MPPQYDLRGFVCSSRVPPGHARSVAAVGGVPAGGRVGGGWIPARRSVGEVPICITVVPMGWAFAVPVMLVEVFIAVVGELVVKDGVEEQPDGEEDPIAAQGLQGLRPTDGEVPVEVSVGEGALRHGARITEVILIRRLLMPADRVLCKSHVFFSSFFADRVFYVYFYHYLFGFSILKLNHVTPLTDPDIYQSMKKHPLALAIRCVPLRQLALLAAEERGHLDGDAEDDDHRRGELHCLGVVHLHRQAQLRRAWCVR